MTQTQFSFEPQRSRNTDPLSSHRAERQMRSSGAMRGQWLITLNLVKEFPGKTSKQLAEYGLLDRYQLARRLPELRQMKLIRGVEIGSEDVRWYAETDTQHSIGQGTPEAVRVS